MVYCSEVKIRDLLHKLSSLDIDEGLRIQNSKKRVRVFINKNASGTFVLQFCNNNDDKENRNNSFMYLDTPDETIKLIKSRLGKDFSVWSY